MTQLALSAVPAQIRSATISSCGTYRYSLERSVPALAADDVSLGARLAPRFTPLRGPLVAWLMLNPSTADAQQDDPTIRKVVGFSRRAGYGRVIVVNLYAFRATDPRQLRNVLRRGPGHVGERLARAEGPANREAIVEAARTAAVVVCAWGAQPWARGQAARVLDWIGETGAQVLCLGLSKAGDPLHPLTLGYDKHPLRPFEPNKILEDRS